jgi:hypothetical protein
MFRHGNNAVPVLLTILSFGNLATNSELWNITPPIIRPYQCHFRIRDRRA